MRADRLTEWCIFQIPDTSRLQNLKNRNLNNKGFDISSNFQSSPYKYTFLSSKSITWKRKSGIYRTWYSASSPASKIQSLRWKQFSDLNGVHSDWIAADAEGIPSNCTAFLPFFYLFGGNSLQLDFFLFSFSPNRLYFLSFTFLSCINWPVQSTLIEYPLMLRESPSNRLHLRGPPK